MIDVPENIHKFNLNALSLLARLYESFPSSIELRPSSVGAAPQDASYDEAFKFSAEADDVVTWLAEEGFLRFQNRDLSGTFYQVRLTLKGLTVLGYIPTSLQAKDRKEPVIDKIKRVLASGTEKASAEAVKCLLSKLFTLALPLG